MRLRFHLRLALGLVAVGMGGFAAAGQVTVFAAASLTDALTAVGQAYQHTHGDHVAFNFASSSTLARQIAAGAPADIFFSADEARMNTLAKQGLIVTSTRHSILSNTLVIIVPLNAEVPVHTPQDLARPRVKRIALGQPDVVPAGVYARLYLTRLKLWSAVKSKVVPTANVRGALAAVELGNVDAGIVYKTDAAISHRVKVVYAVPRADGPRISYPLALMKDAPHRAAARRFLKYLGGPQAAAVFRKFGFLILADLGRNHPAEKN